jgi:hypothetical protein
MEKQLYATLLNLSTDFRRSSCERSIREVDPTAVVVASLREAARTDS